jgi:hypothetical protein
MLQRTLRKESIVTKKNAAATTAPATTADALPKRAPRSGVKLTDAAAATPMPNAVAPASAVPSLVIVPPTTPAGVNLAQEKGLTAAVPSVPVAATPVPPTDAQVHARQLIGNPLAASWVTFYGKRPQGSAAFVEPTKPEIAAMRLAYITEYNSNADNAVKMDPTDIDDLVMAGTVVKSRIDTARNAHAAAVSDQSKIDVEWMRAALHEADEFSATLRAAIVTAGGKVVTKTTASTGTSSTGKGGVRAPKFDWKSAAVKMCAYASELGLAGVYFVDVSVEGYKGVQRPVRLHPDGTWTKATYDAATHKLTDTGVSVPTWKYFDKDGNDRTDATPKEMIPQHNLAKDEMYGVALITPEGTVLDLPGLTADRTGSDGKRIAGSAKHYARMTAFGAACGVSFGKK